MDAGLRVVVTTDIPMLAVIASKMGAIVVARPEELTGPDCSHADTIRHAVAAAGLEGKHVVLLQPTSPFRFDGVVRKCIDAHASNPASTAATCRHLHDWQLGGTNNGMQQFINGCVIVYPFDKVGNYDNVTPVATNPLNYLEIDTEQDYVDACLLSLKYGKIPAPVAPNFTSEITRKLMELGVGGKACTLVARPDGKPIPQDEAVCYVNHCRGYDGGRADVLFIVANAHVLTDDNAELRACIKKCKLVVVRDHGHAAALIERYPDIKDKSEIITYSPHPMVNQVTTGAIAQYILGEAGCDTSRVGFDSASVRAADQSRGHFLGASYDTAIFATYGRPRQ